MANKANYKSNVDKLEIEKNLFSQNEILKQQLKQSNYELEFYKEYLTRLFESMPVMLFAIYSNGVINTWNKIAEEITGITEAEASEKFFWHVIPAFSSFKKKYLEVLNSRSIQKYPPSQFAIDNNGKNIYNFEITLLPLFSQDSPGVVFVINDQTDRFKIETQLQQIQKMETVGALAGGLAHDFNNVLSGVIGTISLMKYKLQTAGKLDISDLNGYIELIDNSSNRAADMVQQLLNLSHKQEMVCSVSDLNIAIKHVIKICQNTFDKSIEIKADLSDKPALAYSDLSKIEQVLLNLCVNASHAMTFMRKKKDGKDNILTISIDSVSADSSFCISHPEAHFNDEYWLISVGDTGIGMPSKVIAKIFEPFFTTKDKGMGTGLGLSMVNNIIKQHSGFIYVYSEEGLGSIFSIYLPAADSSVVLKTRNNKVEIHTGSGLILIIDDEQVMRDTAKFILEECGYTTLLAVNGKEGINLYRDNFKEIKAVLLDLFMPKLNGFETFSDLIKFNPAVKVLLSSGFNKDLVVQQLLNQGAKGFIKKPFTITRLSKAFSAIFEESDIEEITL